jgi:hypothetical protein
MGPSISLVIFQLSLGVPDADMPETLDFIEDFLAWFIRVARNTGRGTPNFIGVLKIYCD